MSRGNFYLAATRCLTGPCAKGMFAEGMFAKGILEGTGFSLFRWESTPELPRHTGQCKSASWCPLLFAQQTRSDLRMWNSRALSHLKRETRVPSKIPLALQSPWPGMGVLTGKSLEVLREVLLGVLWEIGVLWGVLPRVLRETRGAPGSAPEGAQSGGFNRKFRGARKSLG